MDGFLLGYLIVVGIVLIFGLISLLYSLNKVLPYRKPLYWLAIPMNIALILTFAGAIARMYITLPPNTITYALMFSLFAIGLILIILPYVDRLEAKRLNPIDIVTTAQEAQVAEVEKHITGEVDVLG